MILLVQMIMNLSSLQIQNHSTKNPHRVTDHFLQLPYVLPFTFGLHLEHKSCGTRTPPLRAWVASNAARTRCCSGSASVAMTGVTAPVTQKINLNCQTTSWMLICDTMESPTATHLKKTQQWSVCLSGSRGGGGGNCQGSHMNWQSKMCHFSSQ